MFFDIIKKNQACKWQVKKLPKNFSAQKLQHNVLRVYYEQNINWNIHGHIIYKEITRSSC